mmetsp:Transcript_18304/g.53351  ORF Transcript_18304/g.53351 Transcript_18304/m.53351 type:complete len:248 (-) Transcript_18304:60-803(-)
MGCAMGDAHCLLPRQDCDGPESHLLCLRALCLHFSLVPYSGARGRWCPPRTFSLRRPSTCLASGRLSRCARKDIGASGVHSVRAPKVYALAPAVDHAVLPVPLALLPPTQLCLFACMLSCTSRGVFAGTAGRGGQVDALHFCRSLFPSRWVACTCACWVIFLQACAALLICLSGTWHTYALFGATLAGAKKQGMRQSDELDLVWEAQLHAAGESAKASDISRRAGDHAGAPAAAAEDPTAQSGHLIV